MQLMVIMTLKCCGNFIGLIANLVDNKILPIITDIQPWIVSYCMLIGPIESKAGQCQFQLLN